MIRKLNSIKVDMQEVLVFRIKDQNGHHVPLNQSPIQSKVLTLFNSMKKKRGKDATEEKSESSRDWLDLRKETLFITLKCKMKGLMQKMQQVIQKI